MKGRPDRAPPRAPRPDDRRASAMLPGRASLAPWRARHAGRLAGPRRAPRTAPVCRLWRRLFPATASAAVLAEILANIAPYVLRRGGRAARPGRALPARSSHVERNGRAAAPCGRVPMAARAWSGR